MLNQKENCATLWRFMVRELKKKKKSGVVEFPFDFLIQFFNEVEFSSDFESLSGM